MNTSQQATENFRVDPFEYTRGGTIRKDGELQRIWYVWYRDQALGEAHVREGDSREAVVVRAFQVRNRFEEDAKAAVGAIRIQLYNAPSRLECRGFDCITLPRGLSEREPDDSSEWWLVTTEQPKCSAPVTMDQFVRLARALDVPLYGWIASLLPAEVLTNDQVTWRAPTAWELRHVVGEHSFTGASGARAAAIVGTSPSNFRKYTAGDSAKNRQPISFAMWHKLLHHLDVQLMPTAAALAELDALASAEVAAAERAA